MEALRLPIYLITDFGQRDPFVFQVKAAIRAIAPGSEVLDITHDIEAGAIEEAAWTLETNLTFVQERAIVAVVVDPGVGTRRAAVAVSAGVRTFVGPDNGVLSAIVPAELRAAAGGGPARPRVAGTGLEVHELREPRFWRGGRTSSTFHGRDIFGPVAAHLANGLDPSLLGPPLVSMLALPRFEGVPRAGQGVSGFIVHVDRYGNLISTIPAAAIAGNSRVRIAGHELGKLRDTFADVPVGELLAYGDSSGFLGIACNGGSAAQALGSGRGTEVEVLPPL